jgi:hypothetical protein
MRDPRERRVVAPDWQTALSSAQNHDVADAKSFPPCDDSGSSRTVLIDLWRAALVAQMLPPAFDVAGADGKRLSVDENVDADALGRVLDVLSRR